MPPAPRSNGCRPTSKRRIAERTAELLTANGMLEDRVSSLKDAEQIRGRTRDTAVQAGKLAVLGQMAAGVTLMNSTSPWLR